MSHWGGSSRGGGNGRWGDYGNSRSPYCGKCHQSGHWPNRCPNLPLVPQGGVGPRMRGGNSGAVYPGSSGRVQQGHGGGGKAAPSSTGQQHAVPIMPAQQRGSLVVRHVTFSTSGSSGKTPEEGAPTPKAGDNAMPLSVNDKLDRLTCLETMQMNMMNMMSKMDKKMDKVLGTVSDLRADMKRGFWQVQTEVHDLRTYVHKNVGMLTERVGGLNEDLCRRVVKGKEIEGVLFTKEFARGVTLTNAMDIANYFKQKLGLPKDADFYAKTICEHLNSNDIDQLVDILVHNLQNSTEEGSKSKFFKELGDKFAKDKERMSLSDALTELAKECHFYCVLRKLILELFTGADKEHRLNDKNVWRLYRMLSCEGAQPHETLLQLLLVLRELEATTNPHPAQQANLLKPSRLSVRFVEECASNEVRRLIEALKHLQLGVDGKEKKRSEERALRRLFRLCEKVAKSPSLPRNLVTQIGLLASHYFRKKTKEELTQALLDSSQSNDLFMMTVVSASILQKVRTMAWGKTPDEEKEERAKAVKSLMFPMPKPRLEIDMSGQVIDDKTTAEVMIEVAVIKSSVLKTTTATRQLEISTLTLAHCLSIILQDAKRVTRTGYIIVHSKEKSEEEDEEGSGYESESSVGSSAGEWSIDAVEKRRAKGIVSAQERASEKETNYGLIHKLIVLT